MMWTATTLIVMPLTISCTAMGYPCDDLISGNSVAELITAIQNHAVSDHNYASEQVQAPEKIEEWKGAIRQASRPTQSRTLRQP